MNAHPVGLPDRLKYARERMKLTLAQVRKATGVGESSLSDFENGKREPTLSQLQLLAQHYRRSLSFFLDDQPIREEVVLWRKRPVDQNAEEIERLFLRLCEQYRNLEIWCDDVVATDLPTASGDPGRFRFPEAKALANNVGRQLGLGERPGCELLRVLEEEWGVKVFHLDFEPTGVAASAKSEAFGLAILLNKGNVRWRRNFDLAHELFHLLTWDIFRAHVDSSSLDAGEEEERLANVFAASLLMPVKAIQEAVDPRLQDGRLKYEALFHIAREFDVSVESLLWRLHDVYNFGPARVDETKQLIEKAKELRPFLEERERRERETSSAPDWPERYRALAMNALRRGEISVGRFAEYLNISRKKAMEYVEQEPWECEEVQLTPA